MFVSDDDAVSDTGTRVVTCPVAAGFEVAVVAAGVKVKVTVSTDRKIIISVPACS